MAKVEVGYSMDNKGCCICGVWECAVGESSVTFFAEVSLGRFIFYFPDASFYHITFCVAVGALG